MLLHIEVLVERFYSLTQAPLQSRATIGMSRCARVTPGASLSSDICFGNTLKEELCKKAQGWVFPARKDC